MKIAFSTFSIQADIVACALDASSGALPTGFGKSLPMIVLALLPPKKIRKKLLKAVRGGGGVTGL